MFIIGGGGSGQVERVQLSKMKTKGGTHNSVFTKSRPLSVPGLTPSHHLGTDIL